MTFISINNLAALVGTSNSVVQKWANNKKFPMIIDHGISGFDMSDLSSIPEVQAMMESKWDLEKDSTPLRQYNSVELFAGAGGLALGMSLAGFHHVLLNEFDTSACNTLKTNKPNWNVIEGDVRHIDFTPLRGKVDFLSGGFPCQAFSYAGKQAGFNDTRGTLFFELARAVKEIRPLVFMGENVKGLISHDEGRTFSKIMDILQNRLGYVVDSKVMNPCEYANVPQNRERIFIIGFDPKQVVIPSEYFEDNVFHFSFPDKTKLTKTIHSIIDDSVEDDKLFYKQGHIYFDRMKDVITNPDTVYQWRRVYIRENKNGVCPTLTANMGEGGHNVPIVKTSKGIRKFTPEECLSFQGFPVSKGFRYPQTIAQSKKYKQAGNSVTEPLIEKVTEKIIQFVKENEK